MDPYDWYAYRLKKAFKGWGTDDRTMCRILGCADKKDALKIAEAWQREPNPSPSPSPNLTQACAGGEPALGASVAR